MGLTFDWKCGVTNAILTVLVYLLLLKLLSSNATSNVGQPLNSSQNWYESLEVLLLASALVAFNVNSMLFSACTTANAINL